MVGNSAGQKNTTPSIHAAQGPGPAATRAGCVIGLLDSVDTGPLEAQRAVEDDEPHDGVVHLADLPEVRARRVHVRILVVLAIEEVLNVHAQLERPRRGQIERPREPISRLR
jgi:hypothetical protein